MMALQVNSPLYVIEVLPKVLSLQFDYDYLKSRANGLLNLKKGSEGVSGSDSPFFLWY